MDLQVPSEVCQIKLNCKMSSKPSEFGCCQSAVHVWIHISVNNKSDNIELHTMHLSHELCLQDLKHSNFIHF